MPPAATGTRAPGFSLSPGPLWIRGNSLLTLGKNNSYAKMSVSPRKDSVKFLGIGRGSGRKDWPLPEKPMDKRESRLEPQIAGVICRPLAVYEDPRGWLAEVFRQDELAPEHHPVMAYISVTKPGVGRGPHAHRHQSDLFCFPGPGDFRVFLWDQRPESPSFGRRQEFVLGESRPGIIIVPPGVVHGYKNIGRAPGWVVNFANRLYRGPGRLEVVDEIRYEDDADSPFRLE